MINRRNKMKEELKGIDETVEVKLDAKLKIYKGEESPVCISIDFIGSTKEQHEALDKLYSFHRDMKLLVAGGGGSTEAGKSYSIGLLFSVNPGEIDRIIDEASKKIVDKTNMDFITSAEVKMPMTEVWKDKESGKYYGFFNSVNIEEKEIKELVKDEVGGFVFK
jgi:hypothetical protein